MYIVLKSVGGVLEVLLYIACFRWFRNDLAGASSSPFRTTPPSLCSICQSYLVLKTTSTFNYKHFLKMDFIGSKLSGLLLVLRNFPTNIMMRCNAIHHSIMPVPLNTPRVGGGGEHIVLIDF